MTPIEDFAPKHCWCAADVSLHASHGLSHSSTHVSKRHNDIQFNICRLLQKAGFTATTEDRFTLVDESKTKRSDIKVIMAGKIYHLDVRVIHPTADSFVEYAAKESLGAAKQAEKTKNRQYQALAQMEASKFVPL